MKYENLVLCGNLKKKSSQSVFKETSADKKKVIRLALEVRDGEILSKMQCEYVKYPWTS